MQSVKTRISTLTRKGQDLATQAGRLWVTFGIDVAAQVDALIDEHGEKTGYASIRVYLETEYPEHTGPVYGSSIAYRSLQAGRVAGIVGNVLDASVDSLVPLHKFRDDPAKLKAAWKAADRTRGKAPTRAAIIAAMESLEGGPVAGKAGPKAGSRKAGNGGRAKAAKAGTTRTATAPSREVTVREVPDVTGSATKAAAMRLTKVQAACSDPAAFLTLATLVAKVCDDIGSANVLAALQSMAPEKPEPTPRKRTRKAAAKVAA